MFQEKQSDVRIVLFERENLYRAALKRVLDGLPGFSVVDDTDDIGEVSGALRLFNPDVVVADIFPSKGEHRIIEDYFRSFIFKFPNSHVLVLTEEHDHVFLNRAISIGVMGFMLKSVEVSQLIQGVREVAVGRPFFCDTIESPITKDFPSPRTPSLHTLRDAAPSEANKSKLSSGSVDG